MRSAVIAALVSVVAAVPLTETIYNTHVLTITSCGPQVTDCPGTKVSIEVPVTTTICPESEKPTAPPVYHSTSEAVKPSSSAAPPPPSKTPEVVPPPPSKTPEVYPPPSKPVTSEAVKPTSSAVAPPPPAHETTKPAPPPETTPAVPPPPPATGVTSKPAVISSKVPVGTASTGVVPHKTTSAVWSTTTGPAKYTGAASQLNAAGVMVGAGALAALFL